MADVFAPEKRSAVMAAIRGRGNKDTELRFALLLRAHRITGWRRHLPLPGRPDFAFQRARVAIFIDGCFWHACPRHFRPPASSAEFWTRKISENKARDRRVNRELRLRGWTVLRIWEHDLKATRQHRVLARLLKALASQGTRGVPSGSSGQGGTPQA